VADLAARLDVDERTVRRYVAHLADLGIPVRSARGRYGGYRLAAGYRLPPLMFTDDEALAVLLGLVVGGRAGVPTTSVAAAESAVAKLRRVLPTALADRLDALLQTADFADLSVVARDPAEWETTVLLLLAQAARDRKPVAITYVAADGRSSERTVHPYGIVAHAGRWYLTGADSASGASRVFRLDRMSNPQLQSGTFDVPDDFNPAGQVLTGIATAPRRHSVSLLVRATAERAHSLFPAGLVTVESAADDDDSWVRVRLQAERLDWVPAVLAGLDLPFVIESPAALRDLVRECARRLIAAAESRGRPAVAATSTLRPGVSAIPG
jgi:predicted DNA-binding transcriptional regulator YafY